MKRILMILVALVVTISVTAQEKKKGENDKAKKVTGEMTQVLSLDEATATKVYELQSEKFAKLKVANKELKEDKTALQAKKKEINDDFKSKLNPLLGKEKVKIWSDHLKAKKSKKQKK